MKPRIGELFAGYGGLGMGVQAVFGGEMAWYSEIDKGALKILTHRFPDVPNVGDVTAVDWSQVEPVDILTGGSPCQDLSHAGKRQGMTEGTRSNLWVAMREAIAQLRPRLVVWENVRGAYSAQADSDLEFCSGCMGDPWYRGTVLRALGRVLGDLSDLGYDARWHGLRAADIGAPHGRFRVFVIASDARRLRGLPRWGAGPSEEEGWRPLGEFAGRGLLPTPRATDGTKGGPGQRGSSGDLMLPSAVAMLPTPSARDYKDHTIRREPHRPDDTDTLARALTDVPCALLPTPAVNDMGKAYTPETWDAWCAEQQAKHGNGNGHGKSLSIEAQRLLPTPTVQHSARNSTAGRSEDAKPHADGDTLADLVFDGRLLQTPSVSDATGGHERRGGARGEELLLNGQAKEMHGAQWGEYAAAIARWENILGRPAPAPTQTSTKGNPQLSPAFVEWMMGLPAGWVTDAPGITRNEALKALGNGVVPQQAAAALHTMLSWRGAA